MRKHENVKHYNVSQQNQIKKPHNGLLLMLLKVWQTHRKIERNFKMRILLDNTK